MGVSLFVDVHSKILESAAQMWEIKVRIKNSARSVDKHVVGKSEEIEEFHRLPIVRI